MDYIANNSIQSEDDNRTNQELDQQYDLAERFKYNEPSKNHFEMVLVI